MERKTISCNVCFIHTESRRAPSRKKSTSETLKVIKLMMFQENPYMDKGIQGLMSDDKLCVQCLFPMGLLLVYEDAPHQMQTDISLPSFFPEKKKCLCVFSKVAECLQLVF